MTYLILALAVAAAMALFREPLGRTVVWAARIIDWKWAVILAILMFAVWGVLQHVQGPFSAPAASDLVALFDTVTYGDLLIGMTVAILNRQTRQLLGRVVDAVRIAGQLIGRRAGRAGRTPARPRRRLPDREEPESAVWAALARA